ncbi:hypothetical protein AMECASPLE_018480, partial [Ameca splendens]
SIHTKQAIKRQKERKSSGFTLDLRDNYRSCSFRKPGRLDAAQTGRRLYEELCKSQRLAPNTAERAIGGAPRQQKPETEETIESDGHTQMAAPSANIADE